MSNEITYIAEIGSNHCGSLDLALAHIRAAKEAGATGVKFQLFRAETLDSRPKVQERLRPYEIPVKRHSSKTSENWLLPLSSYAHELGLQFGVTPFAVDLVGPLRGLVDFVKISAYDLTYDDLVIEAAKLGVPVVLSTAMAIYEEINHAWALTDKSPSVLLHGIAAYPAILMNMKLKALDDLACYGCAYGISDHTIGHEAAMLAIALGATWIEKHFRLDCPRQDWQELAPGINTEQFIRSLDFRVSATPEQFYEMVVACERARQTLGTGEKNGPLACEEELYDTCRRSNSKPLRG